MQMWFSEYHTVNVKLDVRIEEQLFSGKSEYQKIDVFKWQHWMVKLFFPMQMNLYMMKW